MKNYSEQEEYSGVPKGCWGRVLRYLMIPFKVFRKRRDVTGQGEKQSCRGEADKCVNTRSSLSRTDMEGYCEKVVAYLQESEIYKEPDISVAYVAKATGISSIIISQSINTLLGKNFFNLINGMRVEEIKRMLLDGCQNKYSIEQIARMCGFRSRSSFYLAFNKIEGVTPTEWLKKNKK